MNDKKLIDEVDDTLLPNLKWERMMKEAVCAMLAAEPYCKVISPEHTKKTPDRVVAAFREYFSGCGVNVQGLLESSLFTAKHNQMIHVRDILFHSTCAHHLALISGKAHFAYIPKGQIIGLSKIPRLVDAFARRPQVQEDMADQIVDSFMEYVKPVGCGIFISANHACLQCRGAKSQTAMMETTALRGAFSVSPDTKQEFLLAIRSS